MYLEIIDGIHRRNIENFGRIVKRNLEIIDRIHRRYLEIIGWIHKRNLEIIDRIYRGILEIIEWIHRENLEIINRIHRRVDNVISADLDSCLQSLSLGRNLASLGFFCKCFHGNYFDDLSSLRPRFYEFMHSTRFTDRSHPFTVELYNCDLKFCAKTFSSRKPHIWNSLPVSSFPVKFELQKCNFNINRHS